MSLPPSTACPNAEAPMAAKVCQRSLAKLNCPSETAPDVGVTFAEASVLSCGESARCKVTRGKQIMALMEVQTRHFARWFCFWMSL